MQSQNNIINDDKASAAESPATAPESRESK